MPEPFIRMPDWHDCLRKSRGTDHLTALELFILNHEPMVKATGEMERVRRWRHELREALEEIMNNAIDSNWNSAGSCRHGVSLSLHCVHCNGPTDAARLDWMERHLQRPVELTQDDGTVKHVGGWALISPLGHSLREAIDAAMKGTR